MVDTGKNRKNPKRPLIFYYAVTLLILMLLNWLFFPALMQRRVTEVGYDEFTAMLDEGRVQTVAYDLSLIHILTCAGVSWYLPPNGMNTEFAPIEPSNRSTRPRSRQMPSVEAWFSSFSFSVCPSGAHAMDGADRGAISAVTCLAQPLVLRKSRERCV